MKRQAPPPPEPPPPPPSFVDGRHPKRAKPSAAPQEGSFGPELDMMDTGGHASSSSNQPRHSRLSEGRILFFDRGKGYGFINSDDQPGDIFFPRQALPRHMQDLDASALKGIEVSFELFMKEDGKPRADHLKRIGVGQSPSGSGKGSSGGGLETGEIVRFDEAKGYGFLKLDSDGEDVFFLRSELPPELIGLHNSEQIIRHRVDFEVHLGEGGKRRARYLALVDPPRSRSGASRHGSLHGTIVRYDRQKGYGFVACAEASEDVFFLPSVLPKELSNIEEIVGRDVDIEITISDQGKPRCKHMSLASHGGFASSSGRGSVVPSHNGVAAHVGVIVAYDATKNFGFIKSDSFGEDVFFLKTELPRELQHFERREEFLDRHIEFEVKTMPDGKLRAERMCLLPPVHAYGMPPGGMMPGLLPPPPLPPSNVPVGHIRRFDRQKGYGFIQSNSHPEDIFFLPSTLPKELKDSDQLEGMEVSVEFYISEDGKPRATKVRPLPRGHGAISMPPFMAPMGFHMGMPPMPPMGFPMPFMPMGPPLPPPINHPPLAFGRGGSLMIGTIVRWDAVKGFGFIGPDPVCDIREDVFCLKAELPNDLRDSPTDQLVGQRVEFDIKEMPDGKLRAKNVALASKRRGGSARRSFGTILRFDGTKGYGFIASPDVAGNVFFLRTMLPKELQEGDPEDLKDVDVSFELNINEEGKPRANHILTVASQIRVHPGEVIRGFIVRFDMVKGYGFVKPDELEEDIFILKSALPPTLQAAERKEDVEGRRIEFEVQTMADGKMRAQRATIVEGDDHQPDANSDHQRIAPLDDQQLLEMEEFLEQRGGSCDYGHFTRSFKGVKKIRLEPHFLIVCKDGAPQRIELRDGHPGKPDGPVDDIASPIADVEDFREEVAADDSEPAIIPGPGCQPQGVIMSYDEKKGCGVASCEGFADIFFERSALPKFCQGTNAKEMPKLIGVEVALELSPTIDKNRYRADKVTLLMQWLRSDKCWLLQRRQL